MGAIMTKQDEHEPGLNEKQPIEHSKICTCDEDEDVFQAAAVISKRRYNVTKTCWQIMDFPRKQEFTTAFDPDSKERALLSESVQGLVETYHNFIMAIIKNDLEKVVVGLTGKDKDVLLYENYKPCRTHCCPKSPFFTRGIDPMINLCWESRVGGFTIEVNGGYAVHAGVLRNEKKIMDYIMFCQGVNQITTLAKEVRVSCVKYLQEGSLDLNFTLYGVTQFMLGSITSIETTQSLPVNNKQFPEIMDYLVGPAQNFSQYAVTCFPSVLHAAKNVYKRRVDKCLEFQRAYLMAGAFRAAVGEPDHAEEYLKAAREWGLLHRISMKGNPYGLTKIELIRLIPATPSKRNRMQVLQGRLMGLYLLEHSIETVEEPLLRARLVSYMLLPSYENVLLYMEGQKNRQKEEQQHLALTCTHKCILNANESAERLKDELFVFKNPLEKLLLASLEGVELSSANWELLLDVFEGLSQTVIRLYELFDTPAYWSKMDKEKLLKLAESNHKVMVNWVDLWNFLWTHKIKHDLYLTSETRARIEKLTTKIFKYTPVILYPERSGLGLTALTLSDLAVLIHPKTFHLCRSHGAITRGMVMKEAKTTRFMTAEIYKESFQHWFNKRDTRKRELILNNRSLGLHTIQNGQNLDLLFIELYSQKKVRGLSDMESIQQGRKKNSRASPELELSTSEINADLANPYEKIKLSTYAMSDWKTSARQDLATHRKFINKVEREYYGKDKNGSDGECDEEGRASCKHREEKKTKRKVKIEQEMREKVNLFKHKEKLLRKEEMLNYSNEISQLLKGKGEALIIHKEIPTPKAISSTTLALQAAPKADEQKSSTRANKRENAPAAKDNKPDGALAKKDASTSNPMTKEKSLESGNLMKEKRNFNTSTKQNESHDVRDMIKEAKIGLLQPEITVNKPQPISKDAKREGNVITYGKRTTYELDTPGSSTDKNNPFSVSKVFLHDDEDKGLSMTFRLKLGDSEATQQPSCANHPGAQPAKKKSLPVKEHKCPRHEAQERKEAAAKLKREREAEKAERAELLAKKSARANINTAPKMPFRRPGGALGEGIDPVVLQAIKEEVLQLLQEQEAMNNVAKNTEQIVS